MANGAGDHQVTFIPDPAPGQHLLEQGLVESPPRFVIHVLGRCADVAQFCGAHAALKAFGLTAGCLAINEQPQPFSMVEPGGAVLGLHLGKGFRHAVELECFELIQRWMIEHILSSSMEVIRATDIRVCDRRPVYYQAVHALACTRGRGTGARLAIQTILENGMQ